MLTPEEIEDRLQIFQGLTGLLIGSEPIQDIAQRFVEDIAIRFQADTCVLRIVDGEYLVLIASHGLPDSAKTKHLPSNFGIAKEILRDKTAVVINDAAEDPRTSKHFAASVGQPNKFYFRSYAGVPLLVDGMVHGIIGMYSRERTNAFDSLHLSILRIAANHLGAVVVNDRLYKGLDHANRDLNQNIEKLRHTERLLKQHQESLEQTVIDRTAQLSKALVAAQQAARAKSDFLAMMSHEIRTPMNAVLGMAQLLKHSKLDEEQQEHVDIVYTSTLGLLGIINDILDFTRVDAGKLAMESAAFSIGEVIDEVLWVLKESVKDKQLTLRAELSSDLPELIEGDRHRVRQVLLNLVSNAIKFTENGHVTVRVKPNAVMLDHSATISEIRVEVIDSGIGIPTEAISRLFESFSQVDGSTARKFGGTGLGLAICKRLVEAMGGEIGVHSVEGNGSSFWFNLPTRSTEKSRPVTPQPKLTEAGKFKSYRRNGARILVVEDNTLNSRVIQRLLERLGVENVAIATDGYQCLSILEHHDFDLILMDCHMPGLDGIETTKRIRSLTGVKSSTPIVALTADAMDDNRRECLKAGMNDFIPKPVEIGLLERVLDEMLSATPGPV